MDQINRVITGLLNALESLFRLVLAGFGEAEAWLRAQLTLLGVPRQLGTVILVAAALALALIVWRAFGGLIRALLVLFLVLLLLHLLMPALHA